MSIGEVKKHLADAHQDIQATPAQEASEQWKSMKLTRASEIVDELIGIFEDVKEKFPDAVRLTRQVIDKTESTKLHILASMEGDDHIEEADLVKNALTMAHLAAEEGKNLPFMQSNISQGAKGLLEVSNGVTYLSGFGESLTEVMNEIAELQPVTLQEIATYKQRLTS